MHSPNIYRAALKVTEHDRGLNTKEARFHYETLNDVKM